MLNHAKVQETIKAIEHYRIAYWEYKDPQFVREKRYRPMVSQLQSISSEGSVFTISLFDTWVNCERPGRFFVGKDQVANSEFTNKDLMIALNGLLEFTRVQFMSDQLFNNITQ
jgi:hypothetical protein